MRISVLSGKGGTGKTFISVNLAAVSKNSVYVDCDAEAPNGHLFFERENVLTKPVTTPVPVFDEKLCTGCRACVDFCRFNALVFINEAPLLLPDICHSCGGCELVCKTGALKYEERQVGALESGKAGSVTVLTGILNLGEPSSVPIIKAALSAIPDSAELAIADCPPGSGCAVTESISGADVCIIAAEATSFGFHNFSMVHRLATLLKKPCGVVINKYEEEYPPLSRYCEEHELPVLMKIPYKKDAGKALSTGKILSLCEPEYEELFKTLLSRIGGLVQ